MLDSLKKYEVEGKVIDKAAKQPEVLKEEEPQTMTRAEAEQLIKESAEAQMKELMAKLEEDAAGRTDFAKDPTATVEHPPSYDEKDNVVVTSKSIVDKGNYMNIHRLGMSIAQTADLIVGEFSDMGPVVGKETASILKIFVGHLNEFVARL